MTAAGALMDVDALLGPMSGEVPCGPNLEYDVDFQALEVASRGKPEQVIGETRVAAVPPVWTEIRDPAQALLASTMDLRVVVLWTRAAMALVGLAGLRDGLRLTRGPRAPARRPRRCRTR